MIAPAEPPPSPANPLRSRIARLSQPTTWSESSVSQFDKNIKEKPFNGLIFRLHMCPKVRLQVVEGTYLGPRIHEQLSDGCIVDGFAVRGLNLFDTWKLLCDHYFEANQVQRIILQLLNDVEVRKEIYLDETAQFDGFEAFFIPVTNGSCVHPVVENLKGSEVRLGQIVRGSACFLEIAIEQVVEIFRVEAQQATIYLENFRFVVLADRNRYNLVINRATVKGLA
jgi:hypothetical protein